MSVRGQRRDSGGGRRRCVYLRYFVLKYSRHESAPPRQWFGFWVGDDSPFFRFVRWRFRERLADAGLVLSLLRLALRHQPLVSIAVFTLAEFAASTAAVGRLPIGQETRRLANQVGNCRARLSSQMHLERSHI